MLNKDKIINIAHLPIGSLINEIMTFQDVDDMFIYLGCEGNCVHFYLINNGEYTTASVEFVNECLSEQIRNRTWKIL
jgi:hypothetical protein